MKLTTNILLALTASAGVSQAAIIAQDNFDSYANGTVYGGNGGTGFSGAWGAADPDGTMNVDASGRPTVNPTSGTTLALRDLATPLTDGDNVWIGITLDISDTQATRFFGLSLFNGGSEQGLLGTSSNQEWSYFTPTASTGVSSVNDGSGGNPGPVRLVLNLSLAAGNDAGQLWVVNEGGAIDLSTPDVTFTESIGSITRLRLGAGSGNGTTTFTASGIMDDLVVATTAQEVVTVVPEPSSTALLGLGGLALILRRRK